MNDTCYRKDLVNLTVLLEIKPEKVEEFRDFMMSALPDTAAFPGCEYTHLVQSFDDPTKFYFFERWRSKDDCDKYLAWRGARDGEKIFAMFASAPVFHYGKSVWITPR